MDDMKSQLWTTQALDREQRSSGQRNRQTARVMPTPFGPGIWPFQGCSAIDAAIYVQLSWKLPKLFYTHSTKLKSCTRSWGDGSNVVWVNRTLKLCISGTGRGVAVVYNEYTTENVSWHFVEARLFVSNINLARFCRLLSFFFVCEKLTTLRSCACHRWYEVGRIMKYSCIAAYCRRGK